jgi:hypothetical protein
MVDYSYWHQISNTIKKFGSRPQFQKLSSGWKWSLRRYIGGTGICFWHVGLLIRQCSKPAGEYYRSEKFLFVLAANAASNIKA